jgi:hypothetical protein
MQGFPQLSSVMLLYYPTKTTHNRKEFFPKETRELSRKKQTKGFEKLQTSTTMSSTGLFECVGVKLPILYVLRRLCRTTDN